MSHTVWGSIETGTLSPHCSACCRVAQPYLGDSELLGMKAKSRRGKKSLGPIMPKPLVRFGCILQSREAYTRSVSKTQRHCSPAGSALVQTDTNPRDNSRQQAVQVGDSIWGKCLDTKHREHHAKPDCEEKHQPSAGSTGTAASMRARHAPLSAMGSAG